MMTEQHDRLLAIITSVAASGGPCPTSLMLEKALGLRESRVQVLIGHLADAGLVLVLVERHPANKNRRRFIVIEARTRTDWTAPRLGNAPTAAIDLALVGDADVYMARKMAGRLYEDVTSARFGDAGAAARMFREPTFVQSQSSAAL